MTILDRLASIAAGPDRSPSANGLSRRRLLQAGVAAGGGLLLSLRLPFANGDAEAADADGFSPNAFIRIEGDGQVILTMPYVEIGQGTYTSIPMLIAEELGVDLTQVRLEHAPPNEKLYGNPLLGGVQGTGGSTAIRAVWEPMRQAGAIARTMLVAAAAKRWNVDHASCHAQCGEVLHAPTGRNAKYGDLAADAAGDCGTIVNPDTVQAQVQGAIIFGITAALYGEITLKDGRVEQTNFDTYQVLRMNEAPAIEVHIVQSAEPPGGMGEPGTSAIVPAVTNAIFAATGKRLRKLPIDSAELKSA
jgi:CO/xanthine dehydrogenase Mo-binding subunit